MNLSPHRDQAGLELAWTGASAARQRLRLRIFENRTEGVASSATARLAMLTCARRLVWSTDVLATVARFSSPNRSSRGEPDIRPEIGQVSGSRTLSGGASPHK